jgi:hypothetical protein
VTEADWQACTHAPDMLVFLAPAWLVYDENYRSVVQQDYQSLPGSLRGQPPDRKLRLFACAFCRCHWGRLTDPRCRRAVEAAERFADDPSRGAELLSAQAEAAEAHRAWVAAWEAALTLQGKLHRVRGLHPERAVIEAVRWAAGSTPGLDIERVAAYLWSAHAGTCLDDQVAALGRYADLLREVFGNPFRLVPVEADWLRWNHSSVPALARRIYGERAFHDLPILADALEEAGCDNAELLAHCRGGGPHVRGCWALDVVLGKG